MKLALFVILEKSGHQVLLERFSQMLLNQTPKIGIVCIQLTVLFAPAYKWLNHKYCFLFIEFSNYFAARKELNLFLSRRRVVSQKQFTSVVYF